MPLQNERPGLRCPSGRVRSPADALPGRPMKPARAVSGWMSREPKNHRNGRARGPPKISRMAGEVRNWLTRVEPCCGKCCLEAAGSAKQMAWSTVPARQRFDFFRVPVTPYLGLQATRHQKWSKLAKTCGRGQRQTSTCGPPISQTTKAGRNHAVHSILWR